MWGTSVFPDGQLRPYPKGWGLAASPIFGTSKTHTAQKQCNQILHEDQTRCEENFYTADHASCPGQLFGNRNADARSVCGS